LSSRMSAPSLPSAAIASTKPRWLRHMTATRSPSATPEAARPAAIALLRVSISAKVAVPLSSMIAGVPGNRAADAA
jgi:hypothetical protein